VVHKVNWGILGCARIAEKAFIPAARRSRSGVLAAIASRDEAKAADWGRRFGFRTAHRTYRDLIDDPSVDAVYIPLPNDLHAEWSVRAMTAGKHVLCEKPMALNAPEVQAMIQAAGTHGVLLMEGFMYKFHPQVAKALEILREGAAGETRSVHSSFTFRLGTDKADYRWSRAKGGGALYDLGCYTISVARLVLGGEPISVFAAARVDPGTGVDATAACLLEFPGGRFALCESSFEAQFQSRLAVVGTEGIVRLDRAFSAKDFDTAVEIVRGETVTRAPVPRADMFALMIDGFGEAVLGRAPLPFPPTDAWLNMRAIDACFESIRTGARVVIPQSETEQGGRP
jgi:predicted dehydrogenase